MNLHRPAARKVFLFLIIPAALISLYLLNHFANTGKMLKRERLLMGTIVEIKIPIISGVDKKTAESAINASFEEISRVESRLSAFKKDSELSRINRLKALETMRISEEAFGLIERSIEYSRLTGGAFDITVKPLVDLWRRARSEDRMPSDDEINEAKEKVGSGNIILDRANMTITFNKDGMGLDLGAIAKGYATDRAVDVLKDNGIKNAIVNSGGDMYCLGKKAGDIPWKVGIQHPRDERRLFMEMELGDRAANTSGDYEKYFIVDGVRYSHIIDPASGRPIGDDVVSATVVAKDSVTADVLATALCISAAKALDVVDSVEDADAFLIVKEGDVLTKKMSKNFKARYHGVEKK